MYNMIKKNWCNNKVIIKQFILNIDIVIFKGIISLYQSYKLIDFFDFLVF
jgi:hypothetical protein